MKFSKKQQKELLALSRSSIEHYFETKEFLQKPYHTKEFDAKLPMFVVIYSKRKGVEYVRGIAGSLIPEMDLVEAIIQYSVHAAFFDTNSPRLRPYEMNEIKIAIQFPGKLTKVTKEKLSKIDKSNGIQAFFRGRVQTILPYKWTDISTTEQMIRFINLSLGVRRKLANEINYSTFKVTQLKED